MNILILAPKQTAFAGQLKQLPNELIKLQQGFYQFEKDLFEVPKLIAEYGCWDVFYDNTLQI